MSKIPHAKLRQRYVHLIKLTDLVYFCMFSLESKFLIFEENKKNDHLELLG